MREESTGGRRGRAAANAGAVMLMLALSGAGAQSLRVTPVNILLPPGQRVATLTVTNEGTSETAVQIRAYAWDQESGKDTITASSEIVTSPPLATISPGAAQIVRLMLRHKPEGREATYRLLLDQIPPVASTQGVTIVTRMSIPIFSRPTGRVASHLRFRLERDTTNLYLVVLNDGLCHDVVRDIVLSSTDGRQFRPSPGGLPYVLAGATRRWPVSTQSPLPQPNETLRLTAHTDSGIVEEQVRVVQAP
jgi:fimbrial chaperone protein